MELFKVKGSNDIHMIDDRGNHFISKHIKGVFKCVNPKVDEQKLELSNGQKLADFTTGDAIGSTYPPVKDRISIKIKPIGSVPFRIDSKGRFIRLGDK